MADGSDCSVAGNRELDPPRISQITLNQFLEAHNRYLTGQRGGKRLVLNFTDIRQLDLNGHDLRDAEMVGMLAAGANFKHCTLASANLFGADLHGVDMRNCDLSNADLRGTNLAWSNLEAANLSKADLRTGFILVRDSDGNLVPSRAQESEITGVNLSKANLTSARMSRSCLD